MTNYLTSVGIQQFSITIASASTTGTATINAVGSGAFILRGGSNPSTSANFGQDEGYLTLTNSTTITATRGTGSAGTTLTITGCIIDGDPTNLIKSVQHGTGTITAGGSTGTATISAVTDANTAVHYLGAAMATASVSERADYPTVTLSGTTVTATLGGTSATNLTFAFVIIEFQSSCLTANAVQRVLANSSSSVTSYTASLTHNVVLNNSLSISGGYNIATDTTNLAQGHQYGSLTGVGTFTVNVNTGSAVAKNYAASIVEFNSGVLNSAVQRNTTTLTGVTSNTTTITAVTLANAGLSWLGNTATATTAVLDQASGAGALTNGTTVTVTKTTATSNITGSWEVFEFPAISATNTVTETVTETDSYTVIATDSAAFTETQTGTDSYIGARTSTPLLFTESQTESDSSIILATDKGLFTETQTESDNLGGVITASDGTTETVTSTDANAGLAIANITISELESANDNYDSQVGPSPSPAPAPTPLPVPVQTGSGNDPWKKHIQWLERKKKKQFQKRAAQAGISKPEAIKIASIAAKEVEKREITLKQSPQNEELARHAAQIAINQIYEQIWLENVKEFARLQKIRDEEDEFLMMMM